MQLRVQTPVCEIQSCCHSLLLAELPLCSAADSLQYLCPGIPAITHPVDPLKDFNYGRAEQLDPENRAHVEGEEEG